MAAQSPDWCAGVSAHGIILDMPISEKRLKEIREFKTTATHRVSKVAKISGDKPTEVQCFLRLLERCEHLVRYDRFGHDTVMSMDLLKRKIEAAHPGEPLGKYLCRKSNKDARRYESVVAKYEGRICG